MYLYMYIFYIHVLYIVHVYEHVLLAKGVLVGLLGLHVHVHVITWTLSYTVHVLYIHMYTCIFLLQTWYADALQQQLHPLPSAAAHFTGIDTCTRIFTCCTCFNER